MKEALAAICILAASCGIGFLGVTLCLAALHGLEIALAMLTQK